MVVSATANPCCQMDGQHCAGMFGRDAAFRAAQRLHTATVAQHLVDYVRRLDARGGTPQLLVMGVVNGLRLLAPPGSMRPTLAYTGHAAARRGRYVEGAELLPQGCTLHYSREYAASIWVLRFARAVLSLMNNAADYLAMMQRLLTEALPPAAANAAASRVAAAMRRFFAPACVATEDAAHELLAERRGNAYLRAMREGASGAMGCWRCAPEKLQCVAHHLALFCPSGRQSRCNAGAVHLGAAYVHVGVMYNGATMVSRVDLDSHSVQIYVVMETPQARIMRLVYCTTFQQLLAATMGAGLALMDCIFGGPQQARDEVAPHAPATPAGAFTAADLRAPLQLLDYLETCGASGYPPPGAPTGSITALRDVIATLPTPCAAPPMLRTVLPLVHPYDDDDAQVAAACAAAAAAMDEDDAARDAHYEAYFGRL